jgi:hypothetical protein
MDVTIDQMGTDSKFDRVSERLDLTPSHQGVITCYLIRVFGHRGSLVNEHIEYTATKSRATKSRAQVYDATDSVGVGHVGSPLNYGDTYRDVKADGPNVPLVCQNVNDVVFCAVHRYEIYKEGQTYRIIPDGVEATYTIDVPGYYAAELDKVHTTRNVNIVELKMSQTPPHIQLNDVNIPLEKIDDVLNAQRAKEEGREQARNELNDENENLNVAINRVLDAADELSEAKKQNIVNAAKAKYRGAKEHVNSVMERVKSANTLAISAKQAKVDMEANPRMSAITNYKARQDNKYNDEQEGHIMIYPRNGRINVTKKWI